MRLILVRHGETEWNRQRRIQGLSDLELNDMGKRQAEALGRALKEEHVVAIYSSPLKRARDTALAISRYHSVDLKVLDGLKELDAGEVDGMTYEEMRQHHGEFLAKWVEDCSSIALPGGCSLPELQKEVWMTIQEIVERHRQEKPEGDKHAVVVVAHFFPILSVLCTALGVPLSQCRRLKLNLASISTIDFNSGSTVLARMNDTCHLKDVV